MAQTCHVKATSEESFGCRSSSVLSTDASGDYILYLQGGAHISDPGYIVTVGRSFFLVQIFLREGFKARMTEKAQSAVAFEVKLVSCGMTVVGEEAQLQRVDGQEQGVTSEESSASSLHMLRLRVAISPALNPIFKSSYSSDVSTSSSCASSAACGDEICMGAGLVLRICSC